MWSPDSRNCIRNFDENLPPLQKTLLTLAVVFKSYLYIIAPGIVVVILAIMIWLKSEQGTNAMDTLRFKLPIFGDVWMKYQVAMFSRTLATLLAGGMPLVPSLET